MHRMEILWYRTLSSNYKTLWFISESYKFIFTVYLDLNPATSSSIFPEENDNISMKYVKMRLFLSKRYREMIGGKFNHSNICCPFLTKKNSIMRKLFI